jgi:hypothetical protein
VIYVHVEYKQFKTLMHNLYKYEFEVWKWVRDKSSEVSEYQWLLHPNRHPTSLARCSVTSIRTVFTIAIAHTWNIIVRWCITKRFSDFL